MNMVIIGHLSITQTQEVLMNFTQMVVVAKHDLEIVIKPTAITYAL